HTLELIFEEFFQIPGPQQLRSRGTGLGLPYARLIARSLGGSLEVSSIPGKGSAFVAKLPTGTANSAQPEQTPPAGVPVPQLNSVLVVDDDPAFRLVLTSLLSSIS